jgi:hypothetical protein
MDNKEILIIFIVLACIVFLLIVPSMPYTTGQFIMSSTDLNYAQFSNGDYNGKLLAVDGNKLSTFDVNDLNITSGISDAPIDDLLYARMNGSWADINQYLGGGGNPFDQDLNTTSDVVFNSVTQNGNLVCDVSNNCGYLSSGGWYDTDQSSVNISGFNNDAGFITGGDVSANETDPVFTSWLATPSFDNVVNFNNSAWYWNGLDLVAGSDQIEFWNSTGDTSHGFLGADADGNIWLTPNTFILGDSVGGTPWVTFDRSINNLFVNGSGRFTSGLIDSSNATSIDIDNRFLYDGATPLIDWTGTLNGSAYLSFNNSDGEAEFSVPVFVSNIGADDGVNPKNISIDPNNRVLYARDGSTEILKYEQETGGLYGGSSPVGFLNLINGTLSNYSALEYISLDYVNRLLYSQDGTTPIIDWQYYDAGSENPNNAILSFYNSSPGTGPSVAYITELARIGFGLVDSTNTTLMDTIERQLVDSSNYDSIDWENRVLLSADGSTPTAEWSTPDLNLMQNNLVDVNAIKLSDANYAIYKIGNDVVISDGS